MIDGDLSVIAALVAVGVWIAVLVRAIRTRVDLTTLGLVVIALGLASAVLLATIGIEAPGVWGYLVSGTLLLVLWGRHAPVTR